MSQSLQLLNNEILTTISTVAGISRDPDEWSDADKTDVRQCIRRGLRKFYQPQLLPNSTIHQWRFLERKFYASAEAVYTTGVMNISGGIAILVGGSWPTWSLDGLINTNSQIVYVTGESGADRTIDNTALDSLSITFDGASVYATTSGASATITIVGYTVSDDDVGKNLEITGGTNFTTGTYTVNSVSTSANTWTLDEVCSTGSGLAMEGVTGFLYSLYRYRYPLSDDFAEFIGAVTYTNGSHNTLLKNTDDKEIRLRYATNFRTGQVNMYSIQHGSGDDTAAWYISFWPTFDSNASITALYRMSPLDNLDATDITAEGTTVQIDPVHAETLMAAILSSVDEIYNDRSDGLYHELFLTRLAASIAHDRHVQGNQDFWSSMPPTRSFFLLNHVPTYDVV